MATTPDPADRRRRRRRRWAAAVMAVLIPALTLVLVGILVMVASFRPVTFFDELEDLEIDAPPCAGALVGFDAATGDRRWRRELGADVEFVAEAGGLVLVFDGTGDLRAVDGRTGELGWTVGEQEVPGSSTAVGDELLFVLESGPAGSLSALDLATGEARWSVPVATPNAFLTTLAAGPGAVVVGAVGAEPEPEPSSVTVFDAGTGTVRWTAVPPSPPREVQVPSADVILVTSWYTNAGTVFALDAATGGPRWTVPAPPAEDDAPTRFALSPGAGAGDTVGLARRERRDSTDRSAPRRAKGTLFVDVATGAPLWETESLDVWAGHRASFAFDPTVAGGTLFERGTGGVVVARDPLTGAVRWQHRAPFGYLLAAGSTVFLSDTILQSYDAVTGDRRWSRDVGPDRDGAPVALVDDVLVLAEDNEGPCQATDGAFVPDDN